MIKTTPTPWKIVPVRDGDKSLFFLKDGRNCNITHDMFAYNSDWWDYFNHAVHCVNKMPEAIKSFHVVVRKLEELITSDGFGDEISSFDLRRIKEYCEEAIEKISFDPTVKENLTVAGPEDLICYACSKTHAHYYNRNPVRGSCCVCGHGQMNCDRFIDRTKGDLK